MDNTHTNAKKLKQYSIVGDNLVTFIYIPKACHRKQNDFTLISIPKKKQYIVLFREQ